jgi:DNA-binding CsgD family transcriptional regulator
MCVFLASPQTEIVRLFCLDCTNIEVGAILDLAPSKVEFHKAAAMESLGTNNATLLIGLAAKHHITKQNDSLTIREKRLSGR